MKQDLERIIDSLKEGLGPADVVPVTDGYRFDWNPLDGDPLPMDLEFRPLEFVQRSGARAAIEASETPKTVKIGLPAIGSLPATEFSVYKRAVHMHSM